MLFLFNLLQEVRKKIARDSGSKKIPQSANKKVGQYSMQMGIELAPKPWKGDVISITPSKHDLVLFMIKTAET